MNNFGKTPKDRCYIADGQGGNSFFGIKADTERAEIYFLIGWHLSDDEKILREDIITLLCVLYAFMKQDSLISARRFGAMRNIEFPMSPSQITKSRQMVKYRWRELSELKRVL